MGKKVRLGEFAELVVREYLRVRGYTKTLLTLNEERATKGGNEPLPSAQSWYSVSEEIGLSELLINHKEANPEAMSSIIEVMTSALMRDESIKMRRPPTVRMIRSSPGGSRADPDVFLYDGSSGEVQALSRDGGVSVDRYNQRLGGTTSPERTAGSSVGGKDSSHHHNGKGGEGTEQLSLSRFEKTRRAASHHHKNHRGDNKRPMTSGSSSKHHHLLKPTRYPEEPDRPLVRRMYRPVEFEARKAVMEKTWSNEYWIPDPVRDRMIMRNMHVLKINVDGQRTYKDAIKRRSKWIFVTDLDHNKTQERLGSKHQVRCALCEFKFSEVNMRLAVPYKAIIDLRLLWSSQRPDSLGEFSKKKLAVAALLKPPLCYDRVRVCAFCSQFLNDQEAYRPPLELREEEQRQLERQRLEAEAALWWDPLRVVEEERKREMQADEEAYRAAIAAKESSKAPLTAA